MTHVMTIPDPEPSVAQNRITKAGGVGALVLIVCGIVSCVWDEPAPGESQPAPQPAATGSPTVLQPTTLAELRDRVAAGAVVPLVRSAYPKTFDKLGARQFRAASDLMPWAALAAAEHGGICDRVEVVGLSDSATREMLLWYVTCANGQKIMVEQSEAADIRERYSPEGARR